MRGWIGAGLVLLSWGCSDGFFFEPEAKDLPGAVSISFHAAPQAVAAAGGLATAFDKADRARIALSRIGGVSEEGTAIVDTVVAFNPQNPVVELALDLTVPEGGESFQLIGELRAQTSVLFQGSVIVSLRPDLSTNAEIPISPVSTGLVVPELLTFEALQDTAAVDAFGVFATGDSIPQTDVEWAVLDPEIVAIAVGGALVSLNEGATSAVATVGAFSDTMEIVVSAVVLDVAVQPDVVNADVDQQVQFTAEARDRNGNLLERTAAWTVGNSAIASIGPSTGLLTTQTEGTTTVTAEVDGVTGSADLIVTRSIPLVATVTVDPDSATVELGGTLALQAIARDNQGSQLVGREESWSSSDAGVARVSSAGVVTGLTLGAVAITATVEGVSGTSNVTVIPVPVGTVVVAPAFDTLIVRETSTLRATVRDTNGNVVTDRPLTWQSSNTSVIEVDAAGVITAVGDGSATVTATAEGISGTAILTVPRPTPMAGGTFRYEDNSLLTAILFDPTNGLTPASPTESVTLTGPAGWNGDLPLTCFPYFVGEDGMANDRAVCLETVAAVSGSYVGETALGQTSFSVDASSSIPRPTVDAVRTASDSQVLVEWTGDPAHGSYVVEIHDATEDQFRIAAPMVPGDQTHLVMDVSLDPDTDYHVYVVAFSEDLTISGAPFPSGFRASESDAYPFSTALESEIWVTESTDASVSIFGHPSNASSGGDSGFGAVRPAGIVFGYDFTAAYVADAGASPGVVYVFDTSDGRAFNSIGFGTNIERLAVSSDGVLYATSSNGFVYDIYTSDDTVYDSVSVGTAQGGIAVTPDDSELYVSKADGTVDVISTSSFTVATTIGVGSIPRGVAIHGDQAFVANSGSGTVSVINTDSRQVIATITVGSGPEDVAVSPDGSFAYVVNKEGGTVSVIDTDSLTEVDAFPVGSEPQSVQFSAYDELAFVTNFGSNTISVISTLTDEVIDTIPVGAGPWGIAIFH